MNTLQSAVATVSRQASLGRCARRQIGCVLFDKHWNVLGCGHNGPMMGDCDCPGKGLPSGSGSHAMCYGVHAEMMALFHADARIRPTIPEIHYCVSTKAPCTACVKVLLGTPCAEIIFTTPSNETLNRELWESAGRIWRQYP